MARYCRGCSALVTFKNELGDLTNRVIATFVPGTPYVTPCGEVHIQPDEWDQYWVKAKVNGVSVKFLVDTGASDVVLSSEDAASIGVDSDGLVYSMASSTANGIAYFAPIVQLLLKLAQSHSQVFLLQSQSRVPWKGLY